MPKRMWQSTIMVSGIKTLSPHQKRVVLILAANAPDPVKGKWLKTSTLFWRGTPLVVNLSIFDQFRLSQHLFLFGFFRALKQMQ